MLAQELVWWVEYRPETQWWEQIQVDKKRGVLRQHQVIAARKTP